MGYSLFKEKILEKNKKIKQEYSNIQTIESNNNYIDI